MRLGQCIRFGTAAALLALAVLCDASYAGDAGPTGYANWIGVSVKPLSDRVREEWDYSGAGMMVTAVEPGTPAELAGIVAGDVLVVLGSVSLRSPDDFAEARSRAVPDEPVSVVIARGKGRIINIVNLDMGGAPIPPVRVVDEAAAEPTAEIEAAAEPPSPQAPQHSNESLGIRCEALSTSLAAALSVALDKGVLVLAVTSRSPAEKSGIRPGDVISRVGEQSIGTIADLEKALAKPSGPLDVHVHRQGEERDVEVRFGASATPPAEPPAGEGDNVDQLRETVRQLQMEIKRLRAELEGLRSQQSQ